MSIVRPIERLTRDQKALVRSVPGLAEEVVRAVRRTWGTGRIDADDRLQLAHLGIFRAAQLFQAEKNVPFKHWARYKATRMLQDAIRQRARQDDPLGTARDEASAEYLITATIAGCRDASEADHVQLGKLLGFGESHLVEQLGGMGMAITTMTVEERLSARDEWSYLVDALVASLADLSAELRSLLRWRYVEGLDLKETAAAEGVCYTTLLERHQEAVKLLRARLRRHGVSKVPEACDEAGWGEALIAALMANQG
jgi:RNA polymerase sigma factor (sigma-70 family)